VKYKSPIKKRTYYAIIDKQDACSCLSMGGRLYTNQKYCNTKNIHQYEGEELIMVRLKIDKIYDKEKKCLKKTKTMKIIKTH
jgi:hypothetical protein